MFVFTFCLQPRTLKQTIRHQYSMPRLPVKSQRFSASADRAQLTRFRSCSPPIACRESRRRSFAHCDLGFYACRRTKPTASSAWVFGLKDNSLKVCSPSRTQSSVSENSVSKMYCSMNSEERNFDHQQSANFYNAALAEHIETSRFCARPYPTTETTPVDMNAQIRPAT